MNLCCGILEPAVLTMVPCHLLLPYSLRICFLSLGEPLCLANLGPCFHHSICILEPFKIQIGRALSSGPSFPLFREVTYSESHRRPVKAQHRTSTHPLFLGYKFSLTNPCCLTSDWRSLQGLLYFRKGKNICMSPPHHTQLYK